MMKLLYIEHKKNKHKKIGLTVLALLFMQFMWAFGVSGRLSDAIFESGRLYYLGQFPVLNTIMLPFIVSILASRLCDYEHKGQTFKMLQTIITPEKVFDSKIVTGAIYIFFMTILQIGIIVLIGQVRHFPGTIDPMLYVYHGLFTFTVSFTIYVFQQSLSLLFPNQMISMAIGLLTSFIGLLSLFFSKKIGQFILWSYFGLLNFVEMQMVDGMGKVSGLIVTKMNWTSFGVLLVMLVAIYATGRYFYIRKEW